MISYENKEIEIKGCPGCAYAKHQFDLPCGIAYENERFILSQDWEVPILGFFIVSPKKHIEKLEWVAEWGGTKRKAAGLHDRRRRERRSGTQSSRCRHCHGRHRKRHCRGCCGYCVSR